MKIYTKTGDEGITGLLGNRRVPKDDLRIEAYGTIDELNAALGLARAHGLDPAADVLVGQLQDELFAVGSALADPDPNGKYHNAITLEHATRLEELIDSLETELAPLTKLHSSRRFHCGGADSSGADGLPPRRASGGAAGATVRVQRAEGPVPLPESTQRSAVRPGPRGQSSRRGCGYSLEGALIPVPGGWHGNGVGGDGQLATG